MKLPEMICQRQAALDRTWKALEADLDRLLHIAFHGAGSEADRDIQKRAVLLCIAELYHRRSQREE